MITVETTVASIMTNYVVTVHEDATFREIASKLLDQHVSAVPVVDADAHVVGVVSEADLLVKEAAVADRAVWGSWQRDRRGVMATAERARDLMTSPAVTIGPDASVAEAARLMRARRVKRLPVVTASGHLAGILSRADILSIFGRPDDEIRDEVIAAITAGELGSSPGHLEVAVSSGIVTVSGELATSAAAVELLRAIRHVEGVVNVRSQLRFPHEERPATVVVGAP